MQCFSPQHLMLLNARTTQCKHRWRAALGERGGAEGTLGCQNGPMFCLDVTKIAFPLIPLLLNGEGSRVLDFLTSTTQTVITRRDDGYSLPGQAGREK